MTSSMRQNPTEMNFGLNRGNPQDGELIKGSDLGSDTNYGRNPYLNDDSAQQNVKSQRHRTEIDNTPLVLPELADIGDIYDSSEADQPYGKNPGNEGQAERNVEAFKFEPIDPDWIKGERESRRDFRLVFQELREARIERAVGFQRDLREWIGQQKLVENSEREGRFKSDFGAELHEVFRGAMIKDSSGSQASAASSDDKLAQLWWWNETNLRPSDCSELYFKAQTQLFGKDAAPSIMDDQKLITTLLKTLFDLTSNLKQLLSCKPQLPSEFDSMVLTLNSLVEYSPMSASLRETMNPQ